MTTFFQIVYTACATQALFVFLLLWTRSRNVAANRILAVAIIVVGVSALYTLYARSGWYREHPGWLFAIDSLPSLYGPLFYLYTRELLRQDVRAHRAWVHFIPFAAYTLCELPLMLAPGATKLSMIEAGAPAFSPWLAVLDWAAEFQGLAYLIVCHRLLREHRAALEQDFSNLERKQMKWLGGLLTALLSLWVAVMLVHASGRPWLVYVHAALTVLIYVIAYVNAVRPELFETPARPRADEDETSEIEGNGARAREVVVEREVDVAVAVAGAPTNGAAHRHDHATNGGASLESGGAVLQERRSGAASQDQMELHADAPPNGVAPVSDESIVPAAAPPIRYQKARLKDGQAEEIAARMRALFERDRPYLHPDFALADLVERLGISPHHASQVLNERFGKTFYDHVNSLRVEEVKRRLVDPKLSDEKVLSIGIDCGFSSKSALNNNFKKWVGMTPSEYRKRGGSIQG